MAALSATGRAEVAHAFTCPTSIEVRETPAPGEGWTAEPKTSVRTFGSVSFLDGDPKDRVALAPGVQGSKAGKQRLVVGLGRGSNMAWEAVRPASFCTSPPTRSALHCPKSILVS